MWEACLDLDIEVPGVSEKQWLNSGQVQIERPQGFYATNKDNNYYNFVGINCQR